jgi:hypothetical protein
MTTYRFIESIVAPTVVLALLVGGIAGMALGMGLVFRSEAALAFIARMNRWVSTRRLLKPLEIPRSVEPPSPSGRRPLLAAFFVLGGALVVYVLTAHLQLPRVSPASGASRLLLIVAVDAIRWLLVAGAAAGVVLGLLMMLAPGRYGALEARLNYWYSTRRLIPPTGDAMRLALDPKVQAHPRAAGWLIAGASLAITLAMATLLLARVH